MKNLLKMEELAMFLLSIFFFNQLPYDWWLFLALILLPDLSMLGYLAGPKIGAYVYNFFHHKALAIAVWLLGIYLSENMLQLSGIILFAHSNMDRVFGYGLKYLDDFQHTHLGMIGKKK